MPRALRIAGLIFTVMAAGGTAAAGLLATDGNGLTGYKGTQRFIATTPPFMGSQIDFAADVDYCVYAPGKFGLSFSGQDPSNGALYVYAYQIFNDLDPYPSGPLYMNRKGHVNTISIGLNGGDEYVPHVGYLPGTENSPDTYNRNPSSVKWNFPLVDPQIDFNERSNILIFTSDGSPEYDSATVAGVFPTSQQLPSPAPEPASLAILAAASAFCMLSRRPKRR